MLFGGQYREEPSGMNLKKKLYCNPYNNSFSNISPDNAFWWTMSCETPRHKWVTLPMLGLLSTEVHYDAKIFEDHVNPVMFIFIRLSSC